MKYRRWKDGEWFVGQLVEQPAAISQGKTIEDLEANLMDVYGLVTANTVITPLNLEAEDVDVSD